VEKANFAGAWGFTQRRNVLGFTQRRNGATFFRNYKRCMKTNQNVASLREIKT